MLVVLLVTLLLLILFSYKLFRTPISPSVILAGTFIIGTFFAILGNMQWKVSFDIFAYILIFFAFVFIIIGEYFGRKLVSKTIKQTYIRDTTELRYQQFNISCILILIIICIACLIFYIREQISLAYQFGYAGTLFFKNLRAGLYSGAVENSTISNVCEMIVQILFYYCTYFFIRNRVVYKVKIKKSELLLLVPMICYIILQIFSAARSGFISIAVYLLIVSIALKGKISTIKITKILKYLIFLLVIFFVVFLFLGTLTEKVNNENGLESIYIYAGSSIVAFSKYVENYFNGISYPNKETFVGLFNIIKSFSGGQSDVTSFSLNFLKFNNGSMTNIYTALRAYLNDYGVLGISIIQLCTGIILGYWSAKIGKNKKVPSCISVSLYSYYIYRLVCCLFTPGLTSTMLTVGNIARICFAVCLYIILVKYNFIYKKVR